MISDTYGAGPDPYTYPNSLVLINKFGITDDGQFIEMEKDFSELAVMDIEFSPLPYDSFIVKLAEYYADLNIIHPFREGNGRAQPLLFEHIVINGGFTLSFATVTPEEWIQANIDGYHCHCQRMTELFSRCIR